MAEPPIHKDHKNYYHPQTEKEIIALVNYARENGFEVRVRGSGHSMPQAIFTDPCTLDKVNVLAGAPDGKNVNIKLDRYISILRMDRAEKTVTVQAGIHLGRDPMDPRSTLENSLLYQLQVLGFTLADLGGISHQTVGGFLTTGSSGGSLKYSIQDNVHALRFVDGNGKIFEVSRDDENQDNFNASVVSLGLLGIISTVTFRCEDTFNITGSQQSTLTKNAHVDIYSDDPPAGRIGLTDFLKSTEYTRILWWPQSSELVDKGQSRVQVWQAKRIPPSPDFKPDPYVVFDSTEIMILYSYLMILLGNIDNMEKVHELAKNKEDRFITLTIEDLVEKYHIDGPAAKDIAKRLNLVNTIFLGIVTGITDMCPPQLRHLILPTFTTVAIKLLNEIDKAENSKFQDYGYSGLPMDNSADDIIVPIMWTEMWVPLSRATDFTRALREYFKKEIVTLQRTGNNGWEMYGSKKSDAWLSMSYSDGKDEWKDGAFRVDPYWFIDNKEEFRDMYRPIWLLLKSKGIPFRLHWGKSFPLPDDKKITAEDLVTNPKQYPKLPEFLKLREKRDPQGIFLNSYWRHWLGLTAPLGH